MSWSWLKSYILCGPTSDSLLRHIQKHTGLHVSRLSSSVVQRSEQDANYVWRRWEGMQSWDMCRSTLPLSLCHFQRLFKGKVRDDQNPQTVFLPTAYKLLGLEFCMFMYVFFCYGLLSVFFSISPFFSPSSVISLEINRSGGRLYGWGWLSTTV